MPTPRSVAVSATAWTVGAVASIAIGLVALSLIDTGFSEGPLQPGSVNAVSPEPSLPAQAPDPTPTPAPTASSASPSASPLMSRTAVATYSERTITTAGGTVLVRCLRSSAYLAGWSPAPGFYADDLVRGPAASASIAFETRGREVAVTIRCAGNVPQPYIDDRPRGGGGGGGGRG